ncbi:hypothetical protein [Rhizobium sullae]|uniref:hypothetical protein n=1 Tax=Rhizobium sullae TaxID=50338 RepID=UPI0014045B85|nr:hypothetical protein [Rhizobium sullae]
MASVSCCPGAACFALPGCWPGAQSLAESDFVVLPVVVVSVPLSVVAGLVVVVVVVVVPLVVLVWARGMPADKASMADANNIRFIVVLRS